MDTLFQGKIDWLPISAMQIETSDHKMVTLQIPILNHRWPLFHDNREEALEIARSLTIEQIQAILLYAYSDLPSKRSLAPIFHLCQLSYPQSLQESTFIDDMRNLMHDADSADFSLLSDIPVSCIPVHRAVLAARSRYFRSLFITKSSEYYSGVWKCFRPLTLSTVQFFVEYLYTGQISSPNTLSIIPLCFLVKYLRLSGEKEIENIVISALSRDLNETTVEAIQNCAKEWDAKCVIDVVEKYTATRK